ncbi:hypothetical protein OSTOST_03230 [Ostertagia ostertagi]
MSLDFEQEHQAAYCQAACEQLAECEHSIIDDAPESWQNTAQTENWQYAGVRTCYKHGTIKLNKLFWYLDMQRQDEKRLELFDAEQRLCAALAEHHFEYQHFRNMLDKAHILLDNVVLSQMAVYEPRTFQSLVALAKEMAIKDGRPVIPDDEFKFEVSI